MERLHVVLEDTEKNTLIGECQSTIRSFLLIPDSRDGNILWNAMGFWPFTSTTDQIFCIHQILEVKWEYNDTVHQLFVDFKKVYDIVRWEVLYNILIEFGVPMK
jgi:hypothetical protein